MELNPPLFNGGIVPQLTGRLPLLHTLELQQVNENNWSDETYKSLARWNSVIKLSIRECSFGIDELNNIIKAFPSLEVLRLDNLDFSRKWEPASRHRARSEGTIPRFSLGRLTRLLLDVPRAQNNYCFGEEDLCGWILNSKIDTLEELYVGVSPLSAQFGSHLLKNFRPRVHHLEVFFHHQVRDKALAIGTSFHNVFSGHLTLRRTRQSL